MMPGPTKKSIFSNFQETALSIGNVAEKRAEQ